MPAEVQQPSVQIPGDCMQLKGCQEPDQKLTLGHHREASMKEQC